MSEKSPYLPDRPHLPERPTPYNLNDFPAYKEELMRSARSEEQRARVEQTFSPESPADLAVLTDPEISRDLTGNEHEQEFDRLYPVLDKVMSVHERRMAEARRGLMLHEAVAAAREALVHPYSYVNYWKDVAVRAQHEGEAILQKVAVRNDERLRSLQRELLQDSANAAVASEWYLSLGSLSKLRGGEEILVYAASLPLDTRKMPVYSHSQSEQLLLCGAMLSEASLVNSRYGDRNVDTQRAYEAAARERFQRIIDAHKGNTLEGGIVRQARVYMSDLGMREAHRLSAAAVVHNDSELAALARKTGREAIDDLADCIRQAQAELQSSNDAEIKSQARGELVERAILMLLRENVVSGDKLAQEVPYQAFPRQDYPLDSYAGKGLPRASFDVVLRRFKSNAEGQVGEMEVPIQAKNMDTGMVYDRSILVLANANGQVSEIARDVARMNANPQVAQSAAASMQEKAVALSHKIDMAMARKRAGGVRAKEEPE